MNAHLTDSDREALWLAHELREEMRQALERRGVTSAPGVSPFVDSTGCPSVIVRMDAEAARALTGMLGEQRAMSSVASPMAPPATAPAAPPPVPPPAQRRDDGSHVFPAREPVGYPQL
ncbi:MULTISPECIES: hypothetical protein [Thermomonospora]|jgi:hypothetical protein|uniref:Uncharacterized protein n=1 Tax=Thermomonospora curvata (strain ATCC 19995 / DSM 43183 / JCM 3096 / KCTC 9072 / NBRC 15933 / NCIMB 10081 / Henssen B9) TaxID=471852 RepID=D1A5R5_THECD|nr:MULTISPECIES: hypothetical protein [Thermomonospora]ACY98210.1 hypothetical protein Tcur_2658 [Thermomonospora curvata DSM 43183]PKK13977.1 MAG: hypothetical protein BUE48_012995 [Thermomonospora sp. CIF 1]